MKTLEIKATAFTITFKDSNVFELLVHLYPDGSAVLGDLDEPLQIDIPNLNEFATVLLDLAQGRGTR
jgi:hypothetical protein